jgi:hypothetical protein
MMCIYLIQMYCNRHGLLSQNVKNDANFHICHNYNFGGDAIFVRVCDYPKDAEWA